MAVYYDEKRADPATTDNDRELRSQSCLSSIDRQKKMHPDPNHPITDLDATFAATLPKDTHRLMEALRKAGVYFDVTVNGPKDDPETPRYDIFWFKKEDDQKLIGRILRDIVGEKSL